ncbi:MAG TPA: WD40 repeat domain-containing protein [Microlunatus sp.]|nr:WD40 repeat domain-containing protein [Microlunatus sp.]
MAQGATVDGTWGQRWRLGPSGVGYLVALAVLGLIYLPAAWTGVAGSGQTAGPQLPASIAPYSWYTGMLSTDHFDAATLKYQNGVGVEFMDDPQSVLLSADGRTYRRLDQAENATIIEDQGDPAFSVLSPDGTFVVVGSSGRVGAVQVVRLRDGHVREVVVGRGRAALPLAIGADGRTLLIGTSDDVVNRYGDEDSVGLARLDLQTRALQQYPAVTGVWAAALSPDNSRITVATNRGAQLVDATSGRVTATLASTSEVSLDGDAWSADGASVALVTGSSLVVADVSGPQPELRRHLLMPDSGTVIGWRDASTVLVHAFTDTSDNTSALYWVDVNSGDTETIASYAPNFTGASMLGVDAARDLIPRWHVGPQPVDRGPLPLYVDLLPLGAGVLVAAAVGWVAARLYGLAQPRDLPW